ncbi:MAG: tRNA (adenosine(37)-N6)-threonylcarbamoyltransferase complex dimerization subunit type 1 TsaB [Syntrophomonadaceae bacterium]|nr:tRNA (adenosine(37)-N6)-threonylcarbamoyltransferase complex dimerization subunit type 1 TsaB [Syntrophomonadaceae bacterium]
MLVLGIDSATLVAGMAIMDEQHLVAEGFLQTRKTHSERLLPLIDQWLREAELTLADIGGIAVTVGPGSFTGLRIGLATAKGLAQATGKALVGIPTLDALALNLAGARGLICPILDARKSEVYTALYVSPVPDQVIRISPYLAISPEGMLDWLQEETWPLLDKRRDVVSDFSSADEERRTEGSARPGWDASGYGEGVTFLGDAVPVYWAQIQEKLGAKARRALPGQNWLRAAQVAYLGMQALKQGKKHDYRLLRPFYIRASEAEVKWAQKKGRD